MMFRFRRLVTRVFDEDAAAPTPDPAPAAAPETPPAGENNTHTAATAELAALKADREKMSSELKRARDDAAKYRTRNEEEAASIVATVQKALGLKPEDAASDPEKLAALLNERTEENASLKARLSGIELRSVFDGVARAAGADPVLTWAVLAADGSVSSIDVQSEGLAETLAVLVGDAVKQIPKLKDGPGVPPTSGTEIKGGTQSQTFTREQIRSMTPDEIEQNWETIQGQMKAGKIN